MYPRLHPLPSSLSLSNPFSPIFVRISVIFVRTRKKEMEKELTAYRMVNFGGSASAFCQGRKNQSIGRNSEEVVNIVQSPRTEFELWMELQRQVILAKTVT